MTVTALAMADDHLPLCQYPAGFCSCLVIVSLVTSSTTRPAAGAERVAHGVR
jgi:hypothetical protein